MTLRLLPISNFDLPSARACQHAASGQIVVAVLTREPTEPLPEKPEPDTRTDASRSAPETSRYFFESGVIRLNEVDFRKWEDTFPNVSLRAELTGLAGWAGDQPKWFFAVQGALAKRNRESWLAVEHMKAETAAKANAPKPKACGYVP